jgi:hypothetical protein
MVLTIPFEDFNPQIKQAYSEGRVKGIGMEYQYNGLYGFIDNVEVCVFDFRKFFKIDNRYSSYEIYCGPSQIMIEFIG